MGVCTLGVKPPKMKTSKNLMFLLVLLFVALADSRVGGVYGARHRQALRHIDKYWR
jgi:hypothetical protein